MFLINSFYFKILSAATSTVRKSLRCRFRTIALKGENLKPTSWRTEKTKSFFDQSGSFKFVRWIIQAMFDRFIFCKSEKTINDFFSKSVLT